MDIKPMSKMGYYNSHGWIKFQEIFFKKKTDLWASQLNYSTRVVLEREAWEKDKGILLSLVFLYTKYFPFNESKMSILYLSFHNNFLIVLQSYLNST